MKLNDHLSFSCHFSSVPLETTVYVLNYTVKTDTETNNLADKVQLLAERKCEHSYMDIVKRKIISFYKSFLVILQVHSLKDLFCLLQSQFYCCHDEDGNDDGCTVLLFQLHCFGARASFTNLHFLLYLNLSQALDSSKILMIFFPNSSVNTKSKY